MISVCDSVEALERFYSERLTAACRHAGIPYDRMTRTTFEVQTLVAGDLTVAPQPA